ncbi:NADPH:quinone oxidoreductase family protein [Phyllobacterium ifriqiyense]|uniref:NADPH:quinone oxidoreductase family protein n=1 Tax=Phyllobacterium ifriqiyense TaxID=314238 RepID=UPI00339603A6
MIDKKPSADETMRAVVCNRFGQVNDLRIETVRRPSPGPTEVGIAVRAAGINFADVMAVSGTHQNTPPLPFTPGFEVAGVIEAVGSKVSSLNIGDRVMAAVGHGAFAESLVCPVSHVALIPDTLDFVEAATVPIAFGTAYVSLVHRAGLRAGEWLFVQGGGGNIGRGALQIGKLLGAKTIATGSGPLGCDLVRSLGGDFAIDYKSEDVAARVRELTDGAGASIIFDAVTGPAFLDTLGALAREGRHIIAGAGGGSVPEISLMELITRHVTMIGVDIDDYLHRSPEVTAEFMNALAGWLRQGWLTPRKPITMPLANASQALTLVATGKAGGKIVLINEE